MPSVHDYLPGVHRSPNIQRSPDVYEIENRALDREGKIEAAMREISGWKDRIVVDMGCGTGYYIPTFHEDAAHIYAVEPHDSSRLRAMDRVVSLGLARASVMTGSAEKTLLESGSIGFLHSRFAYFFAGPACEPGIRELDRIMKPGGTAILIDSDYRNGEFASWLQKVPRNNWLPQEDQERFWASYGFQCLKIESDWQFDSREDLESVVRIEFAKKVADEILAGHSGTRVEYTFCLYHRKF
jgi:ubiquinone/menaquinone biosynthesis C-methylase UbiE